MAIFNNIVTEKDTQVQLKLKQALAAGYASVGHAV